MFGCDGYGGTRFEQKNVWPFWGYTKTKIKAEAKSLGFDVNIKDTKADMIDSFVNQTETFIQDLQDSGEFVSAQTDEEDNAEETDSNVRDGGYFN